MKSYIRTGTVRLCRLLLGVTLLTGAGAALAADSALVAKLRALRPDLPIVQVAPSPVPGFVAIELEGGTFLYGSLSS